MDMDKQAAKTLFAWGTIALAVFVMISTTRGAYRTGPMIPQLVPVFGTIFAILFIHAQVLFCFVLDMKKGLGWIALMVVLGFLGGWLGQAFHGSEPIPYDWSRHRIVVGACVSGLVLGIQILRQKV